MKLPAGLGQLGDTCFDGFTDPYVDLCANEAYCRDKACFANGTEVGLCSNPVFIGGACDSNLDEPRCFPCGAGLTCVDGACTRPCTTTEDCPCNDNAVCEPVGVVSGAKFCGVKNVRPGEPCDSYDRCSAPETTCGDTRTKEDVCCTVETGPCANKNDCCGTQVCVSGSTGKTCTACKAQGSACTQNAQCCDGLSCKGGVCSLPCTPDATCDVTGAEGECRKGKITCQAGGVAECKGPSPQPETCDGKDNDCDGKVDNIAEKECEASPSGCQSDFKAPGKTACEKGRPVCKAVAKVDYCTKCDDGGPCGACDVCVAGETPCPPNQICVADDSKKIGECRNNETCFQLGPPACWLPKDIGKCIGGKP